MACPFQEVSLSNFVWEWREASTAGSWRKCVTFPTVIHYELQASGKMADPFVGDNEKAIQWVGWRDWEFRTHFPTPQGIESFPCRSLLFEGLDTIATVLLNDKEILQCDNMFLPQYVDVASALKGEGEVNELRVRFQSAGRVAKEREAEHGKLLSTLRDGSRLYVRKAQYHWGWDWGPKELTCGVYKDVKLQLYRQKIKHVRVATKELSSDQLVATVLVEVEVAEPQPGSLLEVTIESSDGQVLSSKTLEASSPTVSTLFTVNHPALWWPVGHGKPVLHTAVTNLVSTAEETKHVIQRTTTRFGIRNIELIQRPLNSAPGTTFMFQVNGKPIYICGNNWVPAHNQTPAISRETYNSLFDLALRNNNNMIRLWGGGYFEDDAFYDLCDEKGLLVWHDLMTACGRYPVDRAFLQSVACEVRAQVKRLRNHACIALWCGNNEDLMVAEIEGIEFDITDVTGPWDQTAVPQRIIYNKIWPDIIRELMPETDYWPSSPFGGKSSNDPTVGDVHQWNVWHLKQEHYQRFPSMGGRFVSEFGLHAFPDIRTLKVFVPNEADRHPTSRVMDRHNKSQGAESKIGRYLWSNFRLPRTMESFIYLSQLLQAEALDYAIIHWRREWKGCGQEYNAGSINWQLNDSNPTTSWSLVDFYLRRKAAFYTSARAYAPIAVGISRDPFWDFIDDDGDDPFRSTIPSYEIWGSSFHNTPIVLELRLRAYDYARLREISLDAGVAVSTVTLLPNRSTELLKISDDDLKERGVSECSSVILAATLHDRETGEEVGRKVCWPEPYRYLELLESSSATVTVKDDEHVAITCGEYPLKGVYAYVPEEEGEEADWQDNMYDLMPGETIVLGVKGLNGRTVKLRHLANLE